MLSRGVEMAEKDQAPDLTATIHLGLSPLDSAKAGAQNRPEITKTLSSEEQEILTHLSKSDGMLIAHRGPGKGSRYLLSTATQIGRDPASDIFLDDVTISRKHALISLIGDRFALEDLGSLNGTYVNGGSVTKVVLKSSDEIQIGKFHMLFFGGNQ